MSEPSPFSSSAISSRGWNDSPSHTRTTKRPGGSTILATTYVRSPFGDVTTMSPRATSKRKNGVQQISKRSSPICLAKSCSNRRGRSFSGSSAGHPPSKPGGGLTGKSRAPFDALYQPHVVCALSRVAFPPPGRRVPVSSKAGWRGVVSQLEGLVAGAIATGIDPSGPVTGRHGPVERHAGETESRLRTTRSPARPMSGRCWSSQLGSSSSRIPIGKPAAVKSTTNIRSP